LHIARLKIGEDSHSTEPAFTKTGSMPTTKRHKKADPRRSALLTPHTLTPHTLLGKSLRVILFLMASEKI